MSRFIALALLSALTIGALGGCNESANDVATPTYTVRIAKDGNVTLSWDKEAGPFAFKSDGHKELPAALRGLRLSLAKLASNENLRNDIGLSTIRLGVDTEAGVPWLHMQWVMMAAAHPDVMIYRLALRGAPTQPWFNVALPTESSPYEEIIGEPGEEPRSGHLITAVKIKVFRKERATPDVFTRVRLDRFKTISFSKKSAFGTEAFRTDLQKLRDVMTEYLPKKAPKFIELAALPPSGGYVPTSEVIAFCALAREIHDAPVYFEGSADPSHYPPASGGPAETQDR